MANSTRNSRHAPLRLVFGVLVPLRRNGGLSDMTSRSGIHDGIRQSIHQRGALITISSASPFVSSGSRGRRTR